MKIEYKAYVDATLILHDYEDYCSELEAKKEYKIEMPEDEFIKIVRTVTCNVSEILRVIDCGEYTQIYLKTNYYNEKYCEVVESLEDIRRTIEEFAHRNNVDIRSIKFVEKN